MTKQEAINGALRWIDEATVNGTAAANGFIADYKDRAEYLLDNAVAMVESQFPVIETVHYPFFPVEVLQGSHFEARQVNPGERYVFSGAKCFSLELCGWVRVKTDAAMQELKADAFTRVSGQGKNIEIQSDTPFLVRNAGYYGQNLCEIPEYIPWVPCRLPERCNGVERVLFSGDGVTFRDWADWRRVSDDIVAFPRSARGQFDLQYRKRHAPLGVGVGAQTMVEVNEKAQPLVPLRLAVDLTSGIDETLVVNQYLSARFTEMVNALSQEDVTRHQGIMPVYSVF